MRRAGLSNACASLLITPQWSEEDFEGETEEEEEAEDGVENEVEDEADGEAGIAAAPAQAATVKKEAAPSKKVAAPAKHSTPEESWTKVQGAVRNWLLEKAGEQGAVEGG